MGFTKLFAGAAFAVAYVAAGEAGTVHVLTTSNFDEFVKEHDDGALVEFYAPWCGHCKALEPEFNKAAKNLHDSGIKIPLGKVDATVETKLASDYQVQGYPTLKYFVGGAPSEYDGGRTEKDIVDWIKLMAGPAVTEEAPKGDETLSITQYAKEQSEAFGSAAKGNRKKAAWHFVASEDKNEIVLKHLGEDAIISSEIEDTKDAISAFFVENKFPIFGAVSGDTYPDYVARGNGLVWALLEMEGKDVEEVIAEKRTIFTDLAKKLGTDFSVSWTNTIDFKQVLNSMFGVTEFPRVVVQLKAGEKKAYIYDGEIDAEKMAEYIEKAKSGEVKPHLKSEAAPTEPQEAPVKIVTGNTLEEKVFTADKDVLLEIYAPWCGHCKRLEPEYIKLGKKVIKEEFEDMLYIAKMDGTANDSPVDTIAFNAFPTIYYVKAGSDTPIKFEGAVGGRDAKSIWKWIKDNHSKADDLKERLTANKTKRESETTKEEL